MKNNCLRFAGSATAGILLAMLGCSGMQKGLGVISYDRGSQPILARATADGEYSLYTGGVIDPKVSYYLHEGDPLGFKLGQTGQIVAVGGHDEVAVPDADYVWKRR